MERYDHKTDWIRITLRRSFLNYLNIRLERSNWIRIYIQRRDKLQYWFPWWSYMTLYGFCWLCDHSIWGHLQAWYAFQVRANACLLKKFGIDKIVILLQPCIRRSNINKQSLRLFTLRRRKEGWHWCLIGRHSTTGSLWRDWFESKSGYTLCWMILISIRLHWLVNWSLYWVNKHMKWAHLWG
jgi:hypothetical protein